MDSNKICDELHLLQRRQGSKMTEWPFLLNELTPMGRLDAEGNPVLVRQEIPGPEVRANFKRSSDRTPSSGYAAPARVDADPTRPGSEPLAPSRAIEASWFPLGAGLFPGAHPISQLASKGGKPLMKASVDAPKAIMCVAIGTRGGDHNTTLR